MYLNPISGRRKDTFEITTDIAHVNSVTERKVVIINGIGGIIPFRYQMII